MHNQQPTPNPMVTITITSQQLGDLRTFLERSELKGFETVRFLELAQAIGRAKEEPSEDRPIPELKVEE